VVDGLQQKRLQSWDRVPPRCPSFAPQPLILERRGKTYEDETGLPLFLDHEELIVMSGDETMILSDKGEGIALVILLNISEDVALL
jgi:hypothetical protein